MKKLILGLLLVCGMTTCGNAQQADTNDSQAAPLATSADTSSPAQQTVAADKSAEFALTDKGVYPIVLGMKIAEIPAQVPGLYDRVEKVETPDAEEYQFFLGETAMFAAEDWGDGLISAISLWNEAPVKVATTSGETFISL